MGVGSVWMAGNFYFFAYLFVCGVFDVNCKYFDDGNVDKVIY